MLKDGPVLRFNEVLALPSAGGREFRVSLLSSAGIWGRDFAPMSYNIPCLWSLGYAIYVAYTWIAREVSFIVRFPYRVTHSWEIFTKFRPPPQKCWNLGRGRRFEMWRTVMTELQPPVARYVRRTHNNDRHSPRRGKTNASLIKGSVDNIWNSCVLKDDPRMPVTKQFCNESCDIVTGRLMELWSLVKLRFSDLLLGGCKIAPTCHLAVLYGAVIKEETTACGGLSVQTMGH